MVSAGPSPEIIGHATPQFLTILTLIRFLVLAVALSVPVLQALSQNMRFDRIGLEQGLSAGVVTCILQDNDGFMWFGTSDGLNRFDGNRFKVFTTIPGDSTSLSTYYIQALFKDSKGRVWVGTTGGLNRYDPRTGRFVRHALNLPELSDKPLSVMALHEDREHNLWVGTEGLIKISFTESESTTTIRKTAFFGTQGLVVAIQEDTSGMLWLGTFSDGLLQFDPATGIIKNRYRHSRDPFSIASDQIRSIHIDRQQRMWIGTEGSGLDLLDLRGNAGDQPARFTHFQHEKKQLSSLNHNSVGDILEDRVGRIWIATDGGGLDMFDEAGKSFVHHTNNSADHASLNSNRVVSLFEDNAHTLWCGTWGNGLNKYSRVKEKFRNPPAVERMLSGMGNKFVLSLLKARDGTLYAGTHGGGLYQYEPSRDSITGHTHDLHNPNSISNNIVWSVTEDQHGAIWVATYGGVNRLEPRSRTWTRFQHNVDDPETIASDLVTRVVCKDSSIWFTCEKSIGTIHPITGAIDNVFETKEEGMGTFVGMFWDRRGRCWNGPYGLYLFDPLTRTTTLVWDHRKDTSLFAAPILNSFTQARSGDLWAGSFNMGAFRFDSSGTPMDHLTITSGLPSNIVYAVLEDAQQNVWMSTNKGISRFTLSSRKFRNYDTRDGLQNTEFNRGAFFQDETGMMYFGGVNGIDAFHASDIRETPCTSRIVLTGFTRLDQPVTFEQPLESIREIVLPYNENTFSFEFSALDFVDPSRNRYAYVLEGVDPDWVVSGSMRHARYTNVGPGEYLFRLMVSNSDGVWNDNFIPIRIVIPPPFWQQPWFFGLAVISMGAGLIGTVRYLSTRKLRAQVRALEIQQQLQHERERISRDLHDNVGAQLVNIISGLDLVGRYALNRDERSERVVNSLRVDARSSMALLRETIWALNSNGMTLHQFTEHVESYARKQLLFHEGVSLEITGTTTTIAPLSPVQVLNCFRILQEALTNSIKHAEAKRIRITAETENGVLHLILSDDGKGIQDSPGDELSGNGIRNMRLRAEELGGTLSITNGIDSGTEVKVSISIGKH